MSVPGGPQIFEEPELKWYRKYGRDKCKYGNQCSHCCPWCCTIFEYGEDYLIKGVKGMKFEPKGV